MKVGRNRADWWGNGGSWADWGILTGVHWEGGTGLNEERHQCRSTETEETQRAMKHKHSAGHCSDVYHTHFTMKSLHCLSFRYKIKNENVVDKITEFISFLWWEWITIIQAFHELN